MTLRRRARKPLLVSVGAASCNQTTVDWTKGQVCYSTFTTFWVAGHRHARPNERSLEPLFETDGDETMLDRHGDDDAGETSAVKSKIENPANEAFGSRACYTRSMWPLPVPRLVPCLCCWIRAVRRSQTTVGRTRQSSCGKQRLWFFTDGQEPMSKDDSENTKGATPFSGGGSQAEHDDLEHTCAMQTRGGSGSNQGNGLVVEQTSLS